MLHELIALLILAGANIPYAEDCRWFEVRGTSMAPAIADGSIVCVRRRHPEHDDIAIDDVVVVHLRTLKRGLIKRVVATPGDRVCIDEHSALVVNGKRVTMARTFGPALRAQLERSGNVVPSGHYVVLGDAARSRNDSSQLGLISDRRIVGIAADASRAEVGWLSGPSCPSARNADSM